MIQNVCNEIRTFITASYLAINRYTRLLYEKATVRKIKGEGEVITQFLMAFLSFTERHSVLCQPIRIIAVEYTIRAIQSIIRELKSYLACMRQLLPAFNVY